MKTVIHVWNQHCRKYNTDTDWVGFYGLGDLLRGTIGLFKYCKIKGYNFIVDFSLHPISSCMKTASHPYSSIIKRNCNNIYAVEPHIVKSYIEDKLKLNNYVIINTNCNPDVFEITATSELKDFIKGLFNFTDKFKSFYDKQIQTVPLLKYDIIHIRCGDDALFSNKLNSINLWIDKINSIKTPSSILLTDTKQLKDNIDIFKFNTKITHIGRSNDIQAIMGTLFEFVVLTRASTIKTYTTYSWISGFAKIANYIYDIPLEAHVNFNPK